MEGKLAGRSEEEVKGRGGDERREVGDGRKRWRRERERREGDGRRWREESERGGGRGREVEGKVRTIE